MLQQRIMTTKNTRNTNKTTKASGRAALPQLDLAWMRGQAGEVVSLLKVIGNPDRLMLLCQMLQGEYAVGELEEMLEIHQPTLSQQLGVLRKEGLVATRRDGKYIYYTVSHPHVQVILDTLYQLYCVAPAVSTKSAKDQGCK